MKYSNIIMVIIQFLLLLYSMNLSLTKAKI